MNLDGFQFLGIPPKGERKLHHEPKPLVVRVLFPISRDPPEGGTITSFLDTLLFDL